jgi:HEAT repeat protein
MINFDRYISEKTVGFTGRTWVFTAINKWLGEPQGARIFLLTGEPGSGKSAIASRLVQFSTGVEVHPSSTPHLGQNFLSAIHFCSARDIRWTNPHAFIESLAIQLAARYPNFAKALAEKRAHEKIRIDIHQQADTIHTGGRQIGVVINRLDVSGTTPEDAFLRTICEPLEAMRRDQSDMQIVILVDALDEALVYSGEVGIIELLARTEALPSYVRFILTSRPDDRIESEFIDVEGLSISSRKFKRANQQDLNHYLASRQAVLSEEGKLSQLTLKEQKELFSDVAQKAGGNFLYVRFFLDEMASGQRTIDVMERLPAGLDSLYYESLNRVVKLGKKNWTSDYAPLLGCLTVAKVGLSLAQLQAYTGWTSELTWERIGHLQQFIEGSDSQVDIHTSRYRLYHQSVANLLHSPYIKINNRRLRNKYYLSPQTWNQKIADYYIERYAADWSKCEDKYALINIVHHALESDTDEGQIAERLKQIFKPRFMAIRLAQTGWHMPFVNDLQAASHRAPAQVVAPCLQILRGSPPNSRVNQGVLRILRKIWPELKALSVRLVRPGYKADKTIEEIIEALAIPPEEAVGTLEKLLEKTSNIMSKGIIALALGETGHQNAFPVLHRTLIYVKPRQGHVSWCAADGLIALNHHSIVEPSLVPTLLDDFRNPDLSDFTKQRILYVLGRLRVKLPFEEAVALVQEGLSLRSDARHRAVDLIYLLQPEEQSDRERWRAVMEPILWKALGFDDRGVEYDQSPGTRWKNEWLQKRAVTSLGRIGSPIAIPHLKHLASEVDRRPKDSRPRYIRQREELRKSIQRAINNLHRFESLDQG